MTGVFPCRVFFDSDAVIAGSASSTGAAHALLVLSEVGVIHGVVSPQVTEECRRNLAAKLPAALPAFNEIIAHSLAVEQSPTTAWMAKAARYAHPKDAPILAAALQ
ncbi:MAG: hypothetical protein NTV79_02280, partial [Candidatus Aureabacteria bacterium]|nr:hypothetical protein [Candidatus Auribacterota bacterium]